MSNEKLTREKKSFSNLQNLIFFFPLFSLDPLTFKPHNFLISNPFATIVSVSDAPRREVQVLFRHRRQQSPPLGSGVP
jgi:hypothetical protein